MRTINAVIKATYVLPVFLFHQRPSIDGNHDYLRLRNKSVSLFEITFAYVPSSGQIYEVHIDVQALPDVECESKLTLLLISFWPQIHIY